MRLCRFVLIDSFGKEDLAGGILINPDQVAFIRSGGKHKIGYGPHADEIREDCYIGAGGHIFHVSGSVDEILKRLREAN